MNNFVKNLLCSLIILTIVVNWGCLPVLANEIESAINENKIAKEEYKAAKINLDTGITKLKTFFLHPIFSPITVPIGFLSKKAKQAVTYPFKSVINPHFRLQPANIVLIKQRKKIISELKEVIKDFEEFSEIEAQKTIEELEKDICTIAKIKGDSITIPYAIEYASYIEDLYRSGISAQAKVDFGTKISPIILSTIATSLSFTGATNSAAIVGLTGASILSINGAIDPQKRQEFYLEGLKQINKAKTSTILLADGKDIDLVVTAKIINDIEKKLDETKNNLKNTDKLNENLYQIKKLYLDLAANLNDFNLKKLQKFKRNKLDTITTTTKEDEINNTQEEFVNLAWKVINDKKIHNNEKMFLKFQKDVNKLAELLESSELKQSINSTKTELNDLNLLLSQTVKKIENIRDGEIIKEKESKELYTSKIKELENLFKLRTAKINSKNKVLKNALKQANNIYSDALNLINAKRNAGPMLVLTVEKINYEISSDINKNIPDLSKIRGLVKELPKYTLEFSGYNKWVEDQLKGKRMNYEDYLEEKKEKLVENNIQPSRIKTETMAVIVNPYKEFKDIFNPENENLTINNNSVKEELEEVHKILTTIQEKCEELQKGSPKKLQVLKDNQNAVASYLRIYMGRLLVQENKTIENL